MASIYTTAGVTNCINRVFAQGYLNDGYGGGYYKADAVLVVRVNGADKVCAVPKRFGGIFAIREFYLNKDGRIHLARHDCAPAVSADRHHSTMEEAVELHNQTYGLHLKIINRDDWKNQNHDQILIR